VGDRLLRRPAPRRTGRPPVGGCRPRLHDARQTYASLMIAAGVNAKALSTFMGHANIGITLDLYGHLMPGSQAEAATLLDAYLVREIGGTVARTSEPAR
jgi:integrase